MTTIVDSNLPVARPSWDHSRLESRIVHLGCGAFHRAHQALYTHHLLESTDSDWGICEVWCELSKTRFSTHTCGH